MSPKCSTWMQSQKQQNDLCSFPRQTIQYHSNPSLCPTSSAEEAEVEWFKGQIRCLFHYRGLECKSRKSRTTWSNRQIWPWTTEWSRAKANRVLPRKHTGHSNPPSSNNTREDSTHEHRQMVNIKIRLFIFFAAKDREALHSQPKQDQELTVAQIMNSLLPHSDWNWIKWGKPLDNSGMT